jgi:hypothetical protein
MFNVILLSLGMLLPSVPGLGGLRVCEGIERKIPDSGFPVRTPRNHGTSSHSELGIRDPESIVSQPLSYLPEVLQSPPAALHSHPLLHRAAPHGLPSPASLEETNLSDPEEKEEESDDFLLVCNACPGDRIPAMGRRDGAIVGPVPRHGFLHQLHHSWQILC